MPGRPKTARRKKIRASLPQRCVRCGATEGLTLDHIIPRVYGGTNELANFQLLCEACHVEKSKREVRHRHPAANARAGERLRRKAQQARENT